MDLSIVIPVYNSQNIVGDLVKKINISLKSIKTINSYEILLINDFSSDGSWEKIKHLSKNFDFVKGISLKKNFGQHNSIICGLNECQGKYIITMDDDLQHPPNSIKDLLSELDKGHDVCYTNYLNRRHPPWKKFVSWLNNLVSSYLLNKPYNIYLSSFRAFKKEIAKELVKYKKKDVYLDGLILKTTRNISIISVPHNKRPEGKSNYNFFKLLSLWSNMAVNFPIFPLRLSTIFGLILLLIIVAFRKILATIARKSNEQYIISEKTF